MLMEKGADIEAKDNLRQAALHGAAIGHEETLQLTEKT